jgi:uracil-DNA glycosylase
VKLVIVGQAPGPNTGNRAFDGRSGDRLARYMGLEDRETLRAHVELLNVLRRYPGPQGDKGDAFPAGRARRAARRLTGRLRGRTVLLAGKRVAGAFGVRTEYLEWDEHEAGFNVVVIPHPSGVNRWWNDSANREKFTKFAVELLGRAA